MSGKPLSGSLSPSYYLYTGTGLHRTRPDLDLVSTTPSNVNVLPMYTQKSSSVERDEVEEGTRFGHIRKVGTTLLNRVRTETTDPSTHFPITSVFYRRVHRSTLGKDNRCTHRPHCQTKPSSTPTVDGLNVVSPTSSPGSWTLGSVEDGEGIVDSVLDIWGPGRRHQETLDRNVGVLTSSKV